MADLGLDVLDRTVQVTNTWLKRLTETLNIEDRQVAYHSLRSVLFALRDRLPVELSAHLAAQLPLLVRGVYYEGYRPAEQPKTYRSRDEWNQAVMEHYGAPQQDLNPEHITRAVFSVMNRELDRGIVTKVFSALPDDIRELWPEVSENVAQK